jgi:hypothetical protein
MILWLKNNAKLLGELSAESLGAIIVKEKKAHIMIKVFLKNVLIER